MCSRSGWITKDWILYFKRNEQQLLKIIWNDASTLTSLDFKVIAGSIRIFQLGESSEGKHLIRQAQTYANQINDSSLENCIKHFISEEQRHAAYLERFMCITKIPIAKKHWSDHAFRLLRRFWNLETSLAVLLTAELVARVYYRALFAATESPLLKQICRQLLRDEVMHIYFHTDLLRQIRSAHSRPFCFLWNAVYRFFYSGTLIAVWTGHARVLKAGGFSFPHFWQSSQKYLYHALSLLEPQMQMKLLFNAKTRKREAVSDF
jgi:hypothetical protein